MTNPTTKQCFDYPEVINTVRNLQNSLVNLNRLIDKYIKAIPIYQACVLITHPLNGASELQRLDGEFSHLKDLREQSQDTLSDIRLAVVAYSGNDPELTRLSNVMFELSAIRDNKVSAEDYPQFLNHVQLQLLIWVLTPELSELTAVYADTLPSGTINTGYDERAVERFLARYKHVLLQRKRGN